MLSILFYEIDGILVWFGLVSVLFLQNGSRRRKSFIDLLATFHHQEKPRQELEARTEAEEEEEGSRSCLSALLSSLPYTGQARLP